MKKTFEGYSLVETLLSLALLSLIVIVYSNISAFQHTQNNKNALTNRLFMEAHSVASVAEDKSIEDIPMSLFSTSNPSQLPFLGSTNHTISMTMQEYSSQFGVVLPIEILSSNHSITCILSPIQFGEVQYSQMLIYLTASFDKQLIYGYASFVF